MVHGTVTPVGYGTSPKNIAAKEIPTVTSGTIKKGIAIIGFKTSGSPKITGSFTLKIPGRKLSFPRDFRRFDLHLNAMIKARETVLPVPPRKIIRLAKSCVAIYGLTASAVV